MVRCQVCSTLTPDTKTKRLKVVNSLGSNECNCCEACSEALIGIHSATDLMDTVGRLQKRARDQGNDVFYPVPLTDSVV